ncbi:MAG: hypothetical protein AAB418_07820 [candidate division NC10 bacterium]
MAERYFTPRGVEVLIPPLTEVMKDAMKAHGRDRVAELGGIFKDAGAGLVDFPHLRGGRKPL